jgi:hypothetical protein
MRDRELWLRWVLANAAAEFVGLGLVAVVGFVLASRSVSRPLS